MSQDPPQLVTAGFYGDGGDEDITAICAKAAGGDDDARAELLELIHRVLRGQVQRRRGSIANVPNYEPSDLAQDAWMRMARWDLDGKNRRQFFKAISLAVHQSLCNAAVKRRRDTRVASIDAPSEEIEGPVMHDRLPPDDRLRLRIALERFEQRYPKHAEVFNLSHFVGLSRSKIAEVMDLSHGQVAGLVQRAAEKLREEMSQVKDEDLQ